MEITPQNRAKFNALYYGQKVFCSDHENLSNLHKQIKPNVTFGFLVLKNLIDLNEQDARSILNIIWKNSNNRLTNSYYIVRNLNYSELPISVSMEILDYLRSKGYAIRWIDMSVEMQIKEGWIKIKNK